MITKIGQFEAYYPDLEPDDLLLRLFGGPVPKFKNALELHRMCHQLKAQFPEFFKDISFNHDPDFPYSPQIEEGYNRLLVCGLVR
jgi:hypothetical protein